MNTYDLQLLFEDKAGLLMNDINKVFKTSEIERFLNEAQDIYISELADKFEINEKARRSLYNIVYGESVSPTTILGYVKLSDNSLLFDISTLSKSVLDRIVEEQAIDDSGNRIRVKPVTHDEYTANINNPYKQPYGKLVWRVDAEDIIELIPPDGLIISSYELRYIGTPNQIDFSNPLTELSLRDDDLRLVVDLAVSRAINSISTQSTKE